MSRKRKCDYYVFSVFSTEVGDYPYYPFVAKDVRDGIRKYMSFLRNRDTICPGAELHLIGTCEIYPDSICPRNVQPLMLPQRVDIKDNVFGKLLILGTHYHFVLSEYLKKLKGRFIDDTRDE